MGRTSKVNPKSLCEAYNTARQELVGRKLIGENIYDIFAKKGVSKWVISKMLQVPTLFTKVQREGGRGKCVGYMFSYNPVHISWFENWLPKQSSMKKEESKQTTLEEDCIKYLQNQGYKLQKCVGFDEERFRKEHPDIYQRYLKYEAI